MYHRSLFVFLSVSTLKSTFYRKSGFSMFLDNLSLALLEILDKNKYSYKTLAHVCNVSPEFIGKMVRKKASPTIKVLQKICDSLSITPNQLLGVDTSEELSYRSSMRVSDKNHQYPICPRCRANLPRHNQPFCDTCGQKLKWHY